MVLGYNRVLQRLIGTIYLILWIIHMYKVVVANEAHEQIILASYQ